MMMLMHEKSGIYIHHCGKRIECSSVFFSSVLFWPVGPEMIGSNPWQVRMKLNSKQRRL
jgi:hypothetical protein